jgi:hypothetical protein
VTSSIHALTRRIEALEARLADVEGGYGRTLYQLHRHAVRTDLAMGRMLNHLGLTAPTDAEVDAVIDES